MSTFFASPSNTTMNEEESSTKPGPEPREDNLPEVVPDSSPIALSQAQVWSQRGMPGGEEKFPNSAGDLENGEKYSPDPSLVSPATANGGFSSPSRMGTGNDSIKEATVFVNSKERKYCGVRARYFFSVIILLLLVVIGLAVGLGVGLTRGPSSSSSSGDSGSQEGADEPSKTSSESPSSTASASATPSIEFLNNQTEGQGFAFQGFDDTQYMGSSTDIYRDNGFIDLPFDTYSYVWIRNETDCCLTFCQGTNRSVGWWCQDRRQPEASEEFDRIFIGCGTDGLQENSRCSSDDE